MKIAVYTIALNEDQFVERWAKSAEDADYILIADTGSTDGTFEKALDLNINIADISISPWRFDDARNAALALIPKDIDICIALDMDEVLIPGWREKLEGIAETTTRPRYKYTWSWQEDGKPGLEYGGDKIHRRHGYRWKHPVHEVLTADRIEEVQEWIGLEIHHYPDNTKPRSQYFPLLEVSVKEDPYDDRNAFYYARELFYYGQYEKAAKEFERHLSLPTATWRAERAASYRFLAKCKPEFSDMYLTSAIVEDPNRREALVELASFYYEKKSWDKCFEISERALIIKEKPLDYLCEDFAWGSLPFDLAAISAYNLNNREAALYYGQKAVDLNGEQRLKDNLKFYKKNLL